MYVCSKLDEYAQECILNEIKTTIIKFGSWWADSGATAHISNTM